MSERLGTQLQSGGLEQSIHTGLLGKGMFAGASLDLNFAVTKSIGPLVTFTRASSGTYVGSDGLIKTATTNLLLRSEDFSIGAVWPLSGSTLPTITANAGISPDGNATADLWTRTITGSSFISQAITKAATTIQYTFSIFVKQSVGNFCALRIQGAFPARADVVFNIATGAISNAAAAFGGFTEASASIIPYPNNWYRLTFTATSDTATFFQCIASFNSNNAVIDGIDSASNSAGFLWGAQLEQSSTVGEYIPTASTINSAPRFDHNPTTGESLGLLVEESRTNSIRNNTMVGAAAGTPGTPPTNWANVIVTGLTASVASVGTQNGISYIDVRVNGTPSTSSFYNLVPDTLIAGVSGQTWTGSFWGALVGGSLANTNAQIELRESDASQTFLTNTTNSITLSGSLNRFSLTRRLNNVSTAFVSVRFIFQVTSGLPVDFTFRIGLPQLEQGAFATSVIPTTTAAATRSADVASITGTNFSSWYRQDEGTVFAEARTNATHGGTNSFPRVFALNDGGNNNTESYFRVLSSYTDAGYRVDAAGVNQAQFDTNDQRNGQRQSIGYAVNNFAFVVGGATVNADTSGSVPVTTQLRLGARGDGSSTANGTIRRLVYWGQRLPNNVLQAITQ